MLEQQAVGLQALHDDFGKLMLDDALLEGVVHVDNVVLKLEDGQAARDRAFVIGVAHVTVAAHKHRHRPLFKQRLAVLDGKFTSSPQIIFLNMSEASCCAMRSVIFWRHDELLGVLGLQAEDNLMAGVEYAHRVGREHGADDVYQGRLARVGIADDEGNDIETVKLADVRRIVGLSGPTDTCTAPCTAPCAALSAPAGPTPVGRTAASPHHRGEALGQYSAAAPRHAPSTWSPTS